MKRRKLLELVRKEQQAGTKEEENDDGTNKKIVSICITEAKDKH